MQNPQDSLILNYIAFVFLFLFVGRLSMPGGRGQIPFLLIPALPFSSLWLTLSQGGSAYDIYIYCLFSTITFYSIGLFVNAVKMPFESAFIAFYKLFNIKILYLINYALSAFFLPIFAINFFTSESPLSDRISGIQGLSYFFYPYYFLSLGVIVLYTVKKINQEIISFELLISFILSLSGVLLFGSRFFPVLVLVGVLFFSDRISKKINIFLIFLGVVVGLLYFYLVSGNESSVLDLIFYRFINSADILNYIDTKSSLLNISQSYPFDFLDLIYNPLHRLHPVSMKFISPGPYFFQGDGQGPLPLFLFDAIFYFGYLGLFYVIVLSVVFFLVLVKFCWQIYLVSCVSTLRRIVFSFLKRDYTEIH